MDSLTTQQEETMGEIFKEQRILENIMMDMQCKIECMLSQAMEDEF